MVAAMFDAGDSKEAGSAGDQFVEVGGIEQAGLRVDRPFLHNDARVGETSPCALIGLVILPSDDDLVAVVHIGRMALAST